MFSIVIPLYNKEQSITKTLQSVLEQSFTEFEVIIVNDGSTDNSVAKVKEYNDSRIRLIYQQNRGVSAARNRGIVEAKNEWIAFLDADDSWCRQKLEKVSSVIKSNERIDVVFHAFETKIIKNNKLIKNIFKASGDLPSLLNSIVDGLKIQTSAVIAKKELFMNDSGLFFREGMNNSEDREVWYKLALAKKRSFYVNEYLSTYIVDHSIESLTGNNNKYFHFLSMWNRLQSYMSLLSIEEKMLFENFIHDYNKTQISNYWMTLNTFPEDFRPHISKVSFWFFSKTIYLPYFLKKIINNIFFYNLKML